MPRRNNRDRRYEPKEYNHNEGKFTSNDNTPSEKSKPVRRRKSKWDKSIYRENE